MNDFKEEFLQIISSKEILKELIDSDLVFSVLYLDLDKFENFWIEDSFFDKINLRRRYGNSDFNLWIHSLIDGDREKFLKFLKEFRESSDSSFEIELRFRQLNGKIFYLNLKGKRIKTPTDKPRIIGVFVDNTFFRNRENLLLRCNQEARIGFWEVNLLNNSIFWSPTTYQIHEVDPEYIPTLTDGINFYEEGWSRNRIADLVQRGINFGESWEEELIIITQKGNRKWVKAIGVTDLHEGKCIRIFGTFQDIDEKKKAEIISLENEQKFRGIFNSTFTFIGFLDTDGILLEANDTAVNMAGIRHEDVIGKYFWDCYWWQISKKTQDELKLNFQKALRGEECSYEVEVWVSNQTPIFILFSLRPVFDHNGDVISVIPEGRPIQELVQSRKKLESILEATEVGTWEWDFSLSEIVVNEKWAQILGYELEQIKPLTLRKLGRYIHPDDWKDSIKNLNACFRKKTESLEIEVRMIAKNQSWIWVLIKGKVLRWDSKGRPSMMYGTHQDITPKKRIENQMVAFIRDSPNAIAMFDQKMRFLSASEKWLKEYHLDYTIIGQSYYSIFPNTKDKVKKFHQACLAGENIVCDEEEIEDQSNKLKWVRWELKPWYEEQNKIGGVLYYTENITAKKHNEELLRINEESFKNSFDYAAVGMALVDNQGQFIKVNSAFCKMLDYPEEKLMDKTFQEITYPDDLEKDLAFFNEVLAGKRDSYQMEKRYFDSSGNIVDTLLAVSVIRNSKKEILYFIAQIIDLSQFKLALVQIEKANNELAEKNNELEQFAFIAAHDLKEPLRSISALMSLLKTKYSGYLDEKGKKYFELVIDHSKRMGDLIDGILDYSRLGVGEIQLIDLNKLVKTLVSDFFKIEEYSNAIVEIGNLPKIFADISSMKQIFSNLIGNGLKYQEKGSRPNIKVSAKLVGTYWQFVIEDNGIGVDPSNYEKAFTLFKRLHSKSEYSGSGIGLATCQKIVKRYQGEIWIEPNFPKGTIIKFTLPKYESKSGTLFKVK